MSTSNDTDALLPVKKSNMAGNRKCVGILGTGDYARAISKRLIFSGYDVIMGSRSPAARQLSAFDECLCGVTMTSIDDCISRCDVIIPAVHVENFKVTLAPRAELLAGKVVVDVSNRTNRYAAMSNAEFLQSLIPDALVVKAFNSVSAYSMEDQATVSTSRVFVGSDDQAAKERVMDLARDLGFAPCDMGGLKSARSMEAFVLKVFPGWKVPLFFTFGVFNLWALYCVYIYFIDATAYRWDQVFLKVLNKPLCMTAITVLASTYLAGSVAGVVQLFRGTKYRRFHPLLNAWLVSRRHLGLISLTLVLLHTLASTMMLSPTYFSSWFQQPTVVIPANLTGQLVLNVAPAWMIWKGEVACLLGLSALLLLCLVGLTSLPSVSASLNWAEWRFVQSKLGMAALALAAAHAVVMGSPHWVHGGWLATMRSISFLSSLLPMITVALRICLALPPFSRRLHKIRHGWERHSACHNDVVVKSNGSSCSSRKSNLKKGSCGSGNAGARSPIYTAITVEREGEGEDCTSCQDTTLQSSMPTRTCDCSNV